mmetsp:Transcript_10400/g.10051  ORF Transcript_10400/g.10051 Transcript_10400/m.10051 type:complete len:385 (+) Transcript_10400:224-1378(+)
MELQDNNEGEDLRSENGSTSELVGVRDSPCSIASSPSSNGNKTDHVRKSNISELVGKSKKAAFSLWTLLHAKNCRLGVDRCSHPGCSEAKLMYLHHKTCPALLLEPCPTQQKGCQDARKLLAHYRRCRDIRARQSQNPSATNKPQQHVCLVCSLVARHAKFTLDRNASTTTKGVGVGTTSHYIPSLNLSNDSCDGNTNRSMSFVTHSSSNQDSTQQQPRFAFSRRQSNPGDCGSGFEALQAAVSSALNSSNDQSTNASPGTEKCAGRQHFGMNRSHRPRAESLDVRRTHMAPPQYQQQQQQQHEQRNQNEKSMSYLYLAAVDNFSDDHTEEEIPENNHSTNARRRSLSCTVPSNIKQSATGGGNDLLQKSTIAEDLQCILGGGL